MGPCSLLAIKEGEIHLNYDTGFVFAEVNADTIYWQQNEDGKFDPVYRNRTTIGTFRLSLSSRVTYGMSQKP